MMKTIEVKFLIEGCAYCPFNYRSHYGVFLFCKLDPDIAKGRAIDHNLEDLEDYPEWCPFIRKGLSKTMNEADLRNNPEGVFPSYCPLLDDEEVRK